MTKREKLMFLVLVFGTVLNVGVISPFLISYESDFLVTLGFAALTVNIYFVYKFFNKHLR